MQLQFSNMDFIWLHKGIYNSSIIVSFANYIINRKAMKDYIDFIESIVSFETFIPIDIMHSVMPHNKYWLRNDISICLDINNNTNDYKWTHVIYNNIHDEKDYNI